MLSRIFALLLLTITPAALFAADTSALRPPKGAKVALIAFEDLQCPDCRDAEPLLEDASEKYKIPLVRYDFPLPSHNWSYEAHVMARYFDTISLDLGEQFRRWVYANQTSINKSNLRGMVERFADQNNKTLPANYDPQGKLKAKVDADFALGQRVGIVHTPTIYVVSDSQRAQPFVEVVDRSQLFELIEKMQSAEK